MLNTFKKIMPFCVVFGLDRRRFWKKNLYWNYQCLLNVCKYVYESMFSDILQTSCPIKIVLVMFVNQSHALGCFLPSKSCLGTNLAPWHNVTFIKHLLVKSVIQCYKRVQGCHSRLLILVFYNFWCHKKEIK